MSNALNRRRMLGGLAAGVGLATQASADTIRSRSLRALVIHESYEAEPSFVLNSPEPDARYIRDQLRLIPDSHVLYEANPTKGAIFRTLERLARRKTDQDVVFIYYAGHGIQMRHGGDNALLTSDFELLPVSSVVEKVNECWEDETDGIPLIFVLDACRNNPFENLDPSSPHSALADQVAAHSSGLAYPQVGRNEMMFLYACEPGAQAPDSPCRAADQNATFWSLPRRILEAAWLHRTIECPTSHSSLFASALGNRLLDQVPLSAIATAVRRNIRDFGGEQVPWVSSSLTQDIYLNGFPILSPP